VLISALGHEAAHIVRHDYLLNLAYELVTLPLWFHPAMRLLLRRIRHTREQCCDEIVAEKLLEPCAYAHSLVQLAGAALECGRRPAASIAVSMADADILEERIMNILNYSSTVPLCRRLRSTLGALLLLGPCIAAGAFAVQVAIRQPGTAVANDHASPAGAPAQPSDSRQQPAGQSASTPNQGKHAKTPTSIPDGQHESNTILVVADRAGNQAPGSIAGYVGRADGPAGGVAGAVAGGVSGGVDSGVVGKPPREPLPSETANPDHGPSGITEGKLIRLIEPLYPEEAKAAGIQGDVVLEATIGKTGDLEKLQVVSGHPILAAAALAAVERWKYEPYHANGEPLEIENTITFEFRLGLKSQ
jgi:protein TonB